MKVQKLANLKQLQEQHRKNIREYFLGGFLLHLVIILMVNFSCTYFILSAIGSIETYKWISTSFLISLLILIPTVKMHIPPAPTEDDVKESQALRRAFGMDDSISE